MRTACCSATVRRNRGIGAQVPTTPRECWYKRGDRWYSPGERRYNPGEGWYSSGERWYNPGERWYNPGEGWYSPGKRRYNSGESWYSSGERWYKPGKRWYSSGEGWYSLGSIESTRRGRRTTTAPRHNSKSAARPLRYTVLLHRISRILYVRQPRPTIGEGI